MGTYISAIRWKNTIKSTSSRNISIFLNAVFEKPKRQENFQNNLYVTNHIYKHLYFYTRFWWGNLREGDHFGRFILRWSFRKWDVGVCTGSSWLRIGTGGGHL
jgi:hypothetical protein